MNRRDFLKTLCLAVSALVLPKARAIKPEPSLTGTAATLEMSTDGENWVRLPGASLKTHSLTDYTEASDELMADAESGMVALLDSDGCAQTLMGYPMYVFDDMLAMARDAAQVADEQGLVGPWAT